MFNRDFRTTSLVKWLPKHPNGTIVLHITIVTDCVKVSSVDRFHEAHGYYHYNSSIEECHGSKSGHPTYKHATEEIYLWYHQSSRSWYGSTTVCDTSWAALLFRVYNTDTVSPDLVTAGSWRITDADGIGDSVYWLLTVTNICKPCNAHDEY